MMELSRQTFEELALLIRRLCGLAIGADKMYLVRHRLEPVIHDHGLDGFADLLDRLQTRPGSRLHDLIIEAITTKETSFFRDAALFQAIEQRVLPECAQRLKDPAARRQRIRFWSAAASSGQEAYSLAMLVREAAEAAGPSGPQEGQFTILGSDISAAAIETAKAARYCRAELDRGLSGDRVRRHFCRRGDHWSLSEPVRRLVHWRRFNLLDSPAGLGPFDLILCRNVLIYFDAPTRKRICQGFHGILQDSGWLALGAAESLYGVDDRFEAVRTGRALLYRKLPKGH